MGLLFWAISLLVFQGIPFPGPGTAHSVGSAATISGVGAADLGTNAGSTNSLTVAYTVGGGTNRYLVVPVEGDVSATGADDSTGCTYNGTSMALIGKSVATTGNRFQYVYGLVAPTSGTHDVVCSFTSTHYILMGARDYAGVKQSGQPDAVVTATKAAGTPADFTQALVMNQSPNQSFAGTGSTKIVDDTGFGTWAYFDSAGPITPAGSYSMSVNNMGSAFTSSVIMFSLAPL